MIVGQICPSTEFGHLTINGVDMHTTAWSMLDLVELWFPPDYRGENVTIPGASGKRAYPRRIDESHRDLQMVISGAVDRFGNPSAHGAMFQLHENVQYLMDHIMPTEAAATVTASLAIPQGSVLTAAVQVLGLQLGQGMAEIRRAVLELRIPAGRFV